MPVYVVLTALTDEGKRKAERNPADITRISRKIEDVGAKIINQYHRMGSYDIVDVVEVSDGELMKEMERELQMPDMLQDVRFLGPYPKSQAGAGHHAFSEVAEG